MKVYIWLTGVGLLLGCKGSTTTSSVDMGPPPPSLMLPCTDAMSDVYTLPSNLPTYTSANRGDVFRCSYDRYYSQNEVTTETAALGFKGPASSTGFWLYRIAYRTERIKPAAGGNAPEGDTPAYLMIPDKPKANAPLIVFGHGSVGLAESCAPSHEEIANAPHGVRIDPFETMLALVSYGFIVVTPDYAGFSYGQAPGWAESEDEAHSLLDATRAVAKLLPSPPSKVVLVGHSQGGHAVLSAQSFAKSYGLAGQLAGVVAYAPLWISNYAWAGILDPGGAKTTTNNNSLILYTMQYFYGHAELYDGAGAGALLFQAAKRDQAKQVLYSSLCLQAQTSVLGITPYDFFDTNLINSIGGCGTGAGPCNDATAMKWTARFVADRPAIDGNGAPILIWSGGMDATVTPPFAQCGFDKLHADLMTVASPTTTIDACYDANATHSTVNAIIQLDMDWGAQWIMWKAGIGPQPAACPSFPTGVVCQTPPPNL